MRKVFLTLMGMTLSFMPAVFAQQDVNQAAPSTQTTQTVTQTTSTPPVAMTMPESIDPLQISVQGDYLWNDKDDSRLRDGGEVIGRLTYDITPNVALGAESGGLRFKDDIDGVKYGYLDGVPILGDLVLKLPIAATDNRLVPYVYESAGVVIWSYRKSDTADNDGVSTPTRTHFASKPGAGIEYYLTPHVAIFIEGSYLFTEKFVLKGSGTTPPNGKVNVDSMYGGGGIKVAF